MAYEYATFCYGECELAIKELGQNIPYKILICQIYRNGSIAWHHQNGAIDVKHRGALCILITKV
jgi:hypothetical protein